MVERLKAVISKLIGPAQASFIPGRLSTDNIVLVQEAVHSMRRKKGPQGWMLLKLDLEKAYDRIRWDFLENTLVAAGLSEKWVRWIMSCVSGPVMNLLWNGEKTEGFSPSRGLRQGDPISPYLFVLCMERLCHMIERSVASKDWKPISLSRGGPKLSHICFADDLILFAEVSVAQVRVLRKVLESFCRASGQKVSLEKPKIFFSSNVSRELEKEISDASGIQSSRDLGKYLGMPVLQKRMNKDTFGETLARVSSRLVGWKSCVLSMAERLTLTKAVLSSIPVHSMSSLMLPQSTLTSLDRISRSFLWGSSPEHRKQHLLSWKAVCLPKKDGGLGIRSSKSMNLALVAKVGCRLLNDETSLWARVVRKKYKVGNLHDRSWLTPKGTWSVLWRGVAKGLREVIVPGHGWAIGDGSQVNFWKDVWLSGKPLLNSALLEPPENVQALSTKDVWRDGEGWDFSIVDPYLPEQSKLEMRAVVLDHVTGAKDHLAWRDSSNGEFSVTSAYELITRDGNPKQNMSLFYDRIWSVVAPERVRLFIWLVSHQVIMTNVERKRRHISYSDVCSVCKGDFETIIHILRDYPAMAGIWNKIVPGRKRQAFFGQSLLVWLYDNLQADVIVANVPWSTTFVMAVWKATEALGLKGGKRPRVERMIGWQGPPVGWLRLNTDGASHGNPGAASAGGVIKDGDGRWIPQLELEVDSEMVAGFLQRGISHSHSLAFLVRLCHGFLSKDWTVRIVHVFREGNRLADGLANLAFSLPLGFHWFDVVPPSPEHVRWEDEIGISHPRDVLVYFFFVLS
ncbi:unnamed protein product [Microthlaspi erraticum]|uniref:Reverse transcriptase domain-containing protein n=1 Tax=Microthlaspi erraticum TaxID=1685480 RepID=A0A6D2IB72_9BRAS|nr:unnamed protein product [Microthlaspi erraticum]